MKSKKSSAPDLIPKMNSHAITPNQRAELIDAICECYPIEPGMNAHPDYPELEDYLASLSDAQLIRKVARLGIVLDDCAA